MPLVAATARSTALIASTRARSYQGGAGVGRARMRREARRLEPEDARAGGPEPAARVGHDRRGRSRSTRAVRGIVQVRPWSKDASYTSHAPKSTTTTSGRNSASVFGQVSRVRHESDGRSVTPQ